MLLPLLFPLDVAAVLGTLLGGPIGIGNPYLTKVEGGNRVPLPPPLLPLCIRFDEVSLSSGGVSKRLVKRTGVGI